MSPRSETPAFPASVRGVGHGGGGTGSAQAKAEAMQDLAMAPGPVGHGREDGALRKVTGRILCVLPVRCPPAWWEARPVPDR
ncbi:hypothetical protein [Streptomyces celluloflavus]|uniref:hypothetical protein n=1 Tax=Streptomyces celluloflavus TaxID=58344 RepID=UPI0036462139